MRGHQRQSDLRRVERLMREAIKAIIRGHRTYGVWNANSMRWPSCSALSRREERPVASYAESSPPKTRMVTCGEEHGAVVSTLACLKQPAQDADGHLWRGEMAP